MARSILEQMDTLVTGAYNVGRLSIGFYTSVSAGNLRATLIDYAQRFPRIDVSMTESSRARLTTALRNGAIDVAIVTGETPLLTAKSCRFGANALWLPCQKAIDWLTTRTSLGPI
jgi:DNA-binding transcriptional LysR family regulator